MEDDCGPGSSVMWMYYNPHNRVTGLWFPVFLLPPIGVFLSITFLINVVTASNHKPLTFYWLVLSLIVRVLLNT